MHTSNVLQASDFHYVRSDQEGATAGAFGDFCPAYQVSDRVGVVSPCLEDGIAHTGYALLALTTSFYDDLRSGASDFFDYPHHFALIGVTADGVQTHGAPLAVADAPLEATWGNLDVWPDSQWLFVPPTATDMLRKVFDVQISRLFWPSHLAPGPDEAPMPVYLRRMLATRLRSVYYYSAADPDLELQVTQAVEDMVQASLVRLQRATGSTADEPRPRQTAQSANNGRLYREAYRQIPVEEFLGRMHACFERGV